jgi:hypothetical protein
MGDITSLNCGHQQVYFSLPKWYFSMENRGVIISTGGEFWFVQQRSQNILQAEASNSKSGGNYEFSLRTIFIHTLKWFSTSRKILRHGADGITSPPKEGVLWTFIALKNASPWTGLNPRTLDPMTSTLTVTPRSWLLLACKTI